MVRTFCLGWLLVPSGRHFIFHVYLRLSPQLPFLCDRRQLTECIGGCAAGTCACVITVVVVVLVPPRVFLLPILHNRYASLITSSIRNSKDRRLTLNGIYEWIIKNYPYYTDSDKGWKAGPRTHPLCLLPGLCFAIAPACC